MVERSLCMREVQGSIPCISNFYYFQFSSLFFKILFVTLNFTKYEIYPYIQ